MRPSLNSLSKIMSQGPVCSKGVLTFLGTCPNTINRASSINGSLPGTLGCQEELGLQCSCRSLTLQREMTKIHVIELCGQPCYSGKLFRLYVKTRCDVSDVIMTIWQHITWIKVDSLIKSMSQPRDSQRGKHHSYSRKQCGCRHWDKGSPKLT